MPPRPDDRYPHQVAKDCSWPTVLSGHRHREQPPAASEAVGDRLLQRQISICSEISKASSTSIPKYRTVDYSLEWPSKSWTALRLFVRL